MYCICRGGRIIYLSKTKKLKVLPPKFSSKGSTEVLPEKCRLLSQVKAFIMQNKSIIIVMCIIVLPCYY